MWPQLRKTTEKSGVVIIIVLIIIMVMVVFGVTILSQSMSQSKTSRAQVDQIVADQWAKGVFWNAYTSGSCSGSPTTTINNRTYTATISSGSGPDQHCSVTVNY